MQISEEDKTAIEAMFKAFSPRKAERWSYLFNLPPVRWNKISPIDGWPLESEYDSYPNESISALLKKPPLVQHLNSRVLVLRCGHSSNLGLSAMPLREVFPNGELDYKILFEGFVCVVPGKLSIAINHEGGMYVHGT